MANLSNSTVSEYALIVDERRLVAADTIEISFVRKDGFPLPNWEPGSHIDLHLAGGLTRQYSLVPDLSGKCRWVITVLINKEGRGGSLLVDQTLYPGVEIFANGTRNHFILEAAPEYLFIAGGIGVTPFLAMMDEVENKSIPWRLLYLGRSENSMAYLEDLRAKYGEKVQSFTKDSGQRLDVFDALTATSQNTHIYCCGPERLMLEVEQTLGEDGQNRCHVERFHPREQFIDEPDTEFEVYCSKSDIELLIPADESILMTADFAGVEIEGDCMEGTCGSCETKVISGTVLHRDSILTSDAQQKNKTMMICVSRARGRLVLDL